MRGWVVCLLGALAFVAAGCADAQVVINEFMAMNTGGFLDEDLDNSDWIELFNASGSPVNLDGWFLTDNSSEMNKWRVPAETIEPGGFLIVFASGKDRAVAGGELHANFQLEAAGEYLALVRTDGSVADEFAPRFPPQVPGVSYGRAQQAESLVKPGSAGRWHVPTASDTSPAWKNDILFDDSQWTTGIAGFGFGPGYAGLNVTCYKANITVSNLTIAQSVTSTPARRSSEVSEIAPYINYQNTQSVGHFGPDRTFPGLTIGVNVEDFVVLATGAILIPEAGQWTFGVNSDDGFGVDLKRGATTLSFSFPNPRGPLDTLQTFTISEPGLYDVRLVYYDRGGGSEVEFFAAQGAYAVFDANAFHLVGDTANGGLHSFATADTPALKTAMFGVNASLWSRFPFNVPEPDSYDLLRLKMRYADGFVAYLNGTEVARRNAPAALPWNATALADQPSTAVLTGEDINIQAFLGALTTGTNVLAVRGLNHAATGDVFLVEPELLTACYNGALQYLSPPTPRSLNKSGGMGLVESVAFSHSRGFNTAPFDLTLTCPTSGALIYYSVNGNEPTAVTGTTYTAPIQITRTCMVRAAGVMPGWLSSRVETHSYIFVADVIAQSPAGQQPSPDWPSPGTFNGQVMDYGMDPDVVNNAQYSSLMDDALLDLPAMSIVTDARNLFSTATGIYVNASQDTRAWERPASLEVINPDGQPGFQINMGLRIRGGYSRGGGNPKHAFRFFFRSDYGDGHLKFPLFDDEGASEFETVDLRTAQNYSWSFGNSNLNTMNRDVFSRDGQRNLGQPYTRSRYYHLYINGQYWGLYQTQERTESYFAQTYCGGDTDDYDVIKSNADSGYTMGVTDGNMAAYQRLYNAAVTGFTTESLYFRLQGMNPNGARNPAYERLLDTENLADYMICIYYGGNFDCPISAFLSNARPNNVWGFYNRANPDGWKFFCHDSEHTLHDASVQGGWGVDRTGPWTGGDQFQYFNPQWLHQQLTQSEEYRMKFADRVHRAFFSNGPLTPSGAVSSFMARANEIQLAIIAESARWGDSKRALPYTKNADWTPTINNIANNYMTARTQVVLNQFIAKGWYPSNAAPVFTPQSGLISRGSAVQMATTSGTIYYTLDSSDPRMIGGAVSASALVYNPALPPTLFDRTTIKARSRYGSIWSAMNEAMFEIRINAGDLIITEILADARNDDANKEWFEIFNTTGHAIDINGLTIADNGTDRHTIAAAGRLYIASKGYLVLGVTTDTALNGGAPVNYGYGSGITLGNSGDEVVLLQGTSVVHSVGYGNYTTGTYAIVTSLSASPHQGAAFGMAENYWGGPVSFWIDQYSSFGTNGDRGTPGRANDGVYIGPGVDTNAPNLIEGCFARANRIALRFDEILGTATATLAANYTVVTVGAPLTATMVDSARVELQFAADFQYNLWYRVNVTGVADRLGNAISGTTSVLVMLTRPPVTITELMYNPLGGSAFEFIELFNCGAATVNLEGMAFTAGVTYTFGAGVTLDPGAYLLVTSSNPTGDFAAFRAYYGLDASVKIVGPYTGNLSNAGEAVSLNTSSMGSPIFAFEYGDGRGWPMEADGGGHSLVPVAGAQAGVSSGSLYYGGNWRASAYIGGSPGSPEPEHPIDVILNEFAAHTDYMNPPYDSNDWIELYNPTTAPITLTSYYLSDDATSPTKWRIPDGTVVPALGRLVLDEITGFHNPITEGFGLNKAGEDLLLSYLAGGSGDRIVDCVRYKGQENGVTLGRSADGGAFWFAMAPTNGTANAASNPDIVISEIMYHPASLSEEEEEEELENEFIELRNPTSSPINLFNAVAGWRLNGGVSFAFPTTATLPAGGYCLVVPFNPGDTAALSTFTAAYSLLPPAATLYGPYTGRLSNRVDRVALERPQPPDPPDLLPSWVIVDEVIYFEQWPFPSEADGAGLSLHRVMSSAHGCDPANWTAAYPTPGKAPLSLPSIQSTTSTAITTASAVLNGEITNTGGQDPRVTVYWGPSDGGANPLAWLRSADGGPQSSAFGVPISGLAENSIYYYRCYAENAAGGSWSPASISFRSLAVHMLTVYATSGTIHLTPASDGHYDAGTEVQIYAEADADCLFSLWTGDVPVGHETDNPLILTMNADKVLNAEFAAIILTIQPPSLQVTSATGITSAAAILNGRVANTGGEAPQVTVYWGPSDGGINPLSWAQSANLGIQTSAFSLPISELLPNTIYYYRCYGQNAGGTTWSASSMSFRTSFVYTLAVASPNGTVTVAPPELNGRYDPGTIVSLTAEPSSHCIFQRWIGDAPAGCETSNPLVLTMNADKSLTAVIALILPPAIRCTAASAITTVSAYLNGEVTDTGGEAPQVTVYWGLTDGGNNPLAWEQSADLGRRSEAFSVSATSLSANMVYYYRCRAQNIGGESWTSSSASFQTAPSYKLTVYATSGTIYLMPPGAPHDSGDGPFIGHYAPGTQVQLFAEPWVGHLFLWWTGDVPAGHEGDNPLTVTMDSDKATTAVFTTGYRTSGTALWRLY